MNTMNQIQIVKVTFNFFNQLKNLKSNFVEIAYFDLMSQCDARQSIDTASKYETTKRLFFCIQSIFTHLVVLAPKYIHVKFRIAMLSFKILLHPISYYLVHSMVFKSCY